MSTAPQPSSPPLTIIERRLYPRIVPRNPIYLSLDGKNQSLLLNISENGLLVSSPVHLPRKFATLTVIPLHSPLQALLVNVRVVWTSESRMLAGIRLVDLTEYEREQIRKWSRQASKIFAGSASTPSPASAKSIPEKQIVPSTEAESAYESPRTGALQSLDEPPADRAWPTKPVKTVLFLAALLSLIAILRLSPKVYLVREILALLGILGLIAFIAVTLLLLALFLWEGLKRGFSFVQKRRHTTQAVEIPLQEILAEIPECSASPNLLGNP